MMTLNGLKTVLLHLLYPDAVGTEVAYVSLVPQNSVAPNQTIPDVCHLLMLVYGNQLADNLFATTTK
jgi:hypothetical protein